MEVGEERRVARLTHRQRASSIASPKSRAPPWLPRSHDRRPPSHPSLWRGTLRSNRGSPTLAREQTNSRLCLVQTSVAVCTASLFGAPLPVRNPFLCKKEARPVSPAEAGSLKRKCIHVARITAALCSSAYLILAERPGSCDICSKDADPIRLPNDVWTDQTSVGVFTMFEPSYPNQSAQGLFLEKSQAQEPTASIGARLTKAARSS